MKSILTRLISVKVSNHNKFVGQMVQQSSTFGLILLPMPNKRINVISISAYFYPPSMVVQVTINNFEFSPVVIVLFKVPVAEAIWLTISTDPFEVEIRSFNLTKGNPVVGKSSLQRKHIS